MSRVHHFQADLSSVDRAHHLQAGFNSVDRVHHLQADFCSVDRAHHLQAEFSSVDRVHHLQAGFSSVDRVHHLQAKFSSVDRFHHLHSSGRLSVQWTDFIICSMIQFCCRVHYTATFQILMDTVGQETLGDKNPGGNESLNCVRLSNIGQQRT